MNLNDADYYLRTGITDVINEHVINDRPAVSSIYAQTGAVGRQRIFDTPAEAHEYALSLVGGKVAHADELALVRFAGGTEAEYEIAAGRAAAMRRLRLSRPYSPVSAGRMAISDAKLAEYGGRILADGTPGAISTE